MFWKHVIPVEGKNCKRECVEQQMTEKVRQHLQKGSMENVGKATTAELYGNLE